MTQAQQELRWLPCLVQSMRGVREEGADISTLAFASLMTQLVCVFDYLGAVMHFAKHDMLTKTQSLHMVSVNQPQLRDIVATDKAAGRVTVKDSCARNLHRLVCCLKFLRVLLENLARSPQVSIKEAATAAYQESLAPIHSYMVRTAVWAGMYVLPTREQFMSQIGETDESARVLGLQFLADAKVVEKHVEKLFDEISMPASVPSSTILAGLWGGGPAAATSPAKH
eukprot:CAMPEP_0119101848 /NCGR_PEP_ID=MMETSP1180-20130426/782_1 /TAXON_ID=3052 ORGANISM="Chlamydomonas cf sp, Strain CCMP681" /NCGR_SAMPLE_ID=MMETSP1180 /ASSEMBLY_ACC=CAM_ASM_000741 /LENGTH=225 /DNA_ID=CAMNT_0007086027 /DNA_START=85 /DNA_END=762 /DNA_ORIENTATION=+